MFIVGILITAFLSALVTVAIAESRRSNRTPSLKLVKHTIDDIRLNALLEIGELSERCISRVTEETSQADTDTEWLHDLLGMKE